jgi:integrase
MRRKRFQRGSLKDRKRRGKLRWYAQWREEGIPKSKELGLCSETSRVAAEAMLQEILRPINEGTVKRENTNQTFESFIELVYLPIFEQKWKESTRDTETNRIRCHLVRKLGDKVTRKIDRSDLQSLLDNTAKECGKSVVDHLRFRMRSIFKLAISEGVVDRNPAEALFTPRQCKPGRERRVMDWGNLTTIAQLLGFREHVIFRLATWEGMRPGEILGLQLGDVEDDSVQVRRRLYRGKSGDPKNKRSARQVALTAGTKQLLREWIDRAFVNNSDDWLFPSESGRPLTRDNVWKRYMLPKLKPAGLEWATFQVMRRTFATRSKQAGVDAHTRSAQMGNTVDVNENEYAVASFEQKLAAVRRLETTAIQ